jgi:hypothetical protein
MQRGEFLRSRSRDQCGDGEELTMTYDPKCEELAEFFLDESYVGKARNGIIHALAQTIQTSIEDFLEGLYQEEKKEMEYNDT